MINDYDDQSIKLLGFFGFFCLKFVFWFDLVSLPYTNDWAFHPTQVDSVSAGDSLEADSLTVPSHESESHRSGFLR